MKLLMGHIFNYFIDILKTFAILKIFFDSLSVECTAHLLK